MSLPSLRTLLLVDAFSCAGLGATLLAAPTAISGWMALPPTLLTGAGITLLPIAAFLALLTRPLEVPRQGAMLAVAGNLLWVTASLLLPTAGLVSPNELGWAFLLGQASFVALMAALEASVLPPSRAGRAVTS